MTDTRDITGKNRIFTGQDSIRFPKGTTGQRNGSPTAGDFRFNTTLNLGEYYDGTNWKSIDAPPTITQVSVDGRTAGTTQVIDRTDSSSSGVATIVISGSLFDTTNSIVTFVPTGGSGSTVNTQSITRDSVSQITCTVTRSDFIEAGDPYDVKVTNGSGLAATLGAALDVNVPPAFATAADTNLGAMAAGASDFSGLTTAAATDADGDTVTHSISAGSLPPGVSINSNGTFTGTVGAGVAGNDYTFTVSATDGNYAAVTRQFVISGAADAVDAEYTTPGTYTYTVPTGVNSVSVVCVGAGGGGGNQNSGQGGGGGALAYRNSISVTPGQTATVVVGSGGGVSGTNGTAGGSSSFTYGGTATTAGGGGGGQGIVESGGSGGAGGTRSGTSTGGGNGGAGGQDPANYGGPGGGGAGGYSGNGGQGATFSGSGATSGNAGSGGGGGGGGKGGQSEIGGGGGGGVGFYGQGTNGSGGSGSGSGGGSSQGGFGGSGGPNGSGSGGNTGGAGGAKGGGCGGSQSTGQTSTGGHGAVRIVYHPSGAAFPSTNVGDV